MALQINQIPGIHFDADGDPYFPNERFPKLSPKQNEFIAALMLQRFKRLYYGGAVGGGKTYLVLSIADELCKKYPGIRIGVIRKTLTALKRNTIESYYKVLEANGTTSAEVEMHKTTWVAHYKLTGSRIDFIDADKSKDPQLNKLKGLELTAAILEEANEVDSDVLNVTMTRIGRWRNKELGIKSFVLLTSNPDTNWVKSDFYDKWKNNTLAHDDYYLQALPTDNPYVGQDYLDGLEKLPEDLYNRYVLGDWDYVVDKNQLIKTKWLDLIREDNEDFKDCYEPLYVGIDFAREGGDSTVFSFFDDERLLWIEKHKFDTAGPIADIYQQRMVEHPTISPELTAVDAVGIGASLIDTLAERKIFIGSFKGSEKATRALPHFSFYNLKMQANWMFREAIRTRKLRMNYHPELWRQSQVARYKTTDKCLIMATKDEMRALLGCSPDVYDACYIGNFVRENHYMFGRIETSYVKTLLKVRERQALGKRKYLSSVKQMIY